MAPEEVPSNLGIVLGIIGAVLMLWAVVKLPSIWTFRSEKEDFYEPDFTYLQHPNTQDSLWQGGYRLYLQSEQWNARRQAVLKRARNRCQECRKKRRPLEVHHRTYERIGAEWDEDLEALCWECHRGKHGRDLPPRLLEG